MFQNRPFLGIQRCLLPSIKSRLIFLVNFWGHLPIWPPGNLRKVFKICYIWYIYQSTQNLTLTFCRFFSENSNKVLIWNTLLHIKKRVKDNRFPRNQIQRSGNRKYTEQKEYWLEQVWTSLSRFEQVWQVWTGLNKFEQVWTSLNPRRNKLPELFSNLLKYFQLFSYSPGLEKGGGRTSYRIGFQEKLWNMTKSIFYAYADGGKNCFCSNVKFSCLKKMFILPQSLGDIDQEAHSEIKKSGLDL